MLLFYFDAMMFWKQLTILIQILSCSMVHHLTSGIESLMGPTCTLVLETARLVYTVTKSSLTGQWYMYVQEFIVLMHSGGTTGGVRPPPNRPGRVGGRLAWSRGGRQRTPCYAHVIYTLASQVRRSDILPSSSGRSASTLSGGAALHKFCACFSPPTLYCLCSCMRC